MVTALVMLNVDRKHIRNVSQSLVDMKEVSEVYSVAGRYDLVAIVRVQSNEQIADTITVKFSCLLYTSPSPRDKRQARMPSSA